MNQIITIKPWIKESRYPDIAVFPYLLYKGSTLFIGSKNILPTKLKKNLTN